MVVSVLSARHYLEQQLQVKNIDNATAMAIALSLSQLPKDAVMIELQVSDQFDAGHYRFICIVSPTGQTLAERAFTGQLLGAPAWFARIIPIQASPGQAQIQDGWKQYGTVILASNERYAYTSLWEGTLELLLWFVLGGVVTGIAGTCRACRTTGRTVRASTLSSCAPRKSPWSIRWRKSGPNWSFPHTPGLWWPRFLPGSICQPIRHLTATRRPSRPMARASSTPWRTVEGCSH